MVFELLWRFKIAMSQSRRIAFCGLAVAGATRIQPVRSDDSVAAGPPLLIRQTAFLLSSPPYRCTHSHLWVQTNPSA